MYWIRLISVVLLLGFYGTGIYGSTNDGTRLFAHLFQYSSYNKLLLPNQNLSSKVVVRLGLTLVRIIELNTKEQRLTTKMWMDQSWNDYKLKWDPDEYGGLQTLEVPADLIWIPDITLMNTVEKFFEPAAPAMTKAILTHSGDVHWKTLATFNSYCEMDVEYFPFDQQTCTMKFCSWTYDGWKIDLRHKNSDEKYIEHGIDLGPNTHFNRFSTEWEILEAPAYRHEKLYTAADEPYLDILFTLVISRKAMYIMVVPLISISFLTLLVFQLPSNSGEKMPLCAVLLLSYVFSLCTIMESLPNTSSVTSLLSRYILFSMFLLISSVAGSILTINIHYRTPATHKMSPLVKAIFVKFLPTLCCMRRAKKTNICTAAENLAFTGVASEPVDVQVVMGAKSNVREVRPLTAGMGERKTSDPLNPYAADAIDFSMQQQQMPIRLPMAMSRKSYKESAEQSELKALRQNVQDLAKEFSSILEKMARNVQSIKAHFKNMDDDNEAKDDWKCVAMMVDTLLFWLSTIGWLTATTYLILKITHSPLLV